MQKNIFTIPLLTLSLIGISTSAVFAGPVTLTDGNSTAFFDGYVHPRNPNITIDGFWKDWTVDGADNISQSRMHYRINGESFPPAIIMGVDNSSVSDTNSDGNNDTYFIQRSSESTGLQIDTRFSLAGGTDGSGQSSINWMTDFINNSSEDMVVSIFQMLDFDLATTVEYDRNNPDPYMAQVENEYGEMLDSNKAKQWDEQTLVSMVMTDVDHWYCGTPM